MQYFNVCSISFAALQHFVVIAGAHHLVSHIILQLVDGINVELRRLEGMLQLLVCSLHGFNLID